MIAQGNQAAQLAAIRELRWRLFSNSLRSNSGKIEFGSRIVAASIYILGALGAAIGLGVSAYSFSSHHVPGLLAVLLWPVFFSWQILPVMISSFSDNVEIPGLLRFPLSYRAYVLVRLLDGLMDVGTILGVFCLTGILSGVAAANPALLLPGLLILLIFAAMNVLLSRMIFAWMERWLAQRRTREWMAGLFIVLLLGTQLIVPFLRNYTGRTDAQIREIGFALAPIQSTLPPGIAAAAIEHVAAHNYLGAAASAGYLLLYAAAIGSLLGMRLRAAYHGENLSEAGAQNSGIAGAKSLKANSRSQSGSRIPAPAGQKSLSPSLSTPIQAKLRQSLATHFSADPIAAVMGKELRYLLRSGPMLITLLTPVFMLIVLSSQWEGGKVYRFPAGVAYTLLVLSNLLYNCFGTDGPGILLYLTAPVRMRTVIVAKNLTSVCILLLQMVLIFAAIALIYGMPDLEIVAATVAWTLFSLPLNLAIGNRLSFQSPRKMSFEKFGRQQTSTLNALTSLGVQLATVGAGALVLLLVRHQPSLWAAAVIFAALAMATISIYLILLNHIERVALNHREILISELCKP